MQKIFCIGMFKNEADIIESFIRYHSCIFDGIILVDNWSTDNSVKIVKDLQNEGLPVYLKEDSNMGQFQSERTTELLYDTLNEFNADIIFPIDLDEFVIAPDYPLNPRDIINQLDTKEILYYIQRKHYHPLSSDNDDELFIPRRIKHVRTDEDEDLWPKVVITKDLAKKYSPIITNGNHDLWMDKSKIKMEKLSKLKLAHFHNRSLDQLKSKFTVGWLNTLIKHNYVEGQARHWKWEYDKIKDNIEIKLENIIGTPTFKKAPINLSFCDQIEIKYTSKNEVNYLKNLLNYCENLVKEYAKLKKG